MISSSRSTLSVPSLATSRSRKLARFLAKSGEALPASLPARLTVPMMLTPLWTTISSGSRQWAVAAPLDREIDDHRARLHAFDHLLRDEDRRRPAGDQRGGDHDVLRLHVLGDECRLLLLVFGRQLLGIAAGGRRIRDIGEDELGAKALDLLLGRLAHIGRRDDGAEPPRRGDRLQAGNADAHDEHLGRRHGAGRRHHHRKGAAEIGGGIDHRLVAGEIGLT